MSPQVLIFWTFDGLVLNWTVGNINHPEGGKLNKTVAWNGNRAAHGKLKQIFILKSWWVRAMARNTPTEAMGRFARRRVRARHIPSKSNGRFWGVVFVMC